MNSPKKRPTPNAKADPRQPHPQESFTKARADAILAERRRTLTSLRGDISARFMDLLDQKIKREYESVLAILEAHAKNADAHRRLNTLLRSEYFSQKPLDINLI